MSFQQPIPQPSSVFDADEPVIASHPLLVGAQVPLFGNTAEWNLNGVIRRPANLAAGDWTLVFSNELTEPSWNLLARELSMIMFNPRHPAVIAAGLSLKPTPANAATVISRLSHLRRLANWAHANGLPGYRRTGRTMTCDALSGICASNYPATPSATTSEH